MESHRQFMIKLHRFFILLHAIVWKQVYKYIWKTASVHSSLLTVRTLLYNHYFFFVALRPNAGHGLLILEVF